MNPFLRNSGTKHIAIRAETVSLFFSHPDGIIPFHIKHAASIHNPPAETAGMVQIHFRRGTKIQLSAFRIEPVQCYQLLPFPEPHQIDHPSPHNGIQNHAPVTPRNRG